MWLFDQGSIPLIIKDADPTLVNPPEAILEGVEGLLGRLRIHQIPAKAEILRGEAYLTQQSSGQIGLIADAGDRARSCDGSTQPQHRDVIAFGGIILGAVWIAEAMIGEEDDQAVLPGRKLLEAVDEMP